VVRRIREAAPDGLGRATALVITIIGALQERSLAGEMLAGNRLGQGKAESAENAQTRESGHRGSCAQSGLLSCVPPASQQQSEKPESSGYLVGRARIPHAPPYHFSSTHVCL